MIASMRSFSMPSYSLLNAACPPCIQHLAIGVQHGCLEELATLGLSEAMLDRLLYANAARILGLTDAGS
jgi:hypothetical protein